MSVMSQTIVQSQAAVVFEGSAPENIFTGLVPDGLVKYFQYGAVHLARPIKCTQPWETLA